MSNINLSFTREQFDRLCDYSDFRDVVFDKLQSLQNATKPESPELAAFREAVKLNPDPYNRIPHIKHIRSLIPGMMLVDAKNFVELAANRLAVGLPVDYIRG